MIQTSPTMIQTSPTMIQTSPTMIQTSPTMIQTSPINSSNVLHSNSQIDINPYDDSQSNYSIAMNNDETLYNNNMDNIDINNFNNSTFFPPNINNENKIVVEPESRFTYFMIKDFSNQLNFSCNNSLYSNF